ncbi:uncharacterized protein LOC116345515 [Contarinia nasturtii]|uniref:uncharacterized protein LOC116345515 n=1 Tax=Contarinia nasturtii TaxID=265458 RepID=UPI0012D47FB7|nr:uncharacterized protein LOC116345515 [Contarinia nasturtii]
MLPKFVFFLILLTKFCSCDDLSYGREEDNLKPLFEKVLFSQHLDQPKNYTLIFKYIASESSPNITFAKFEVPGTKTQGSIDVSKEKGKEKTLQAQLNIVNGTNIHVTCKIYGPSVNLLDAATLGRMSSSTENNPKTVTVIYGHNTSKTRNRKVNLGLRQTGDKLINFQRKNVTLSYRFPEAEFECKDKNNSITSVAFSFDSPTAIAFINSTYLSEHQVNVIAYDLNNPYFEANMSVYGYDSRVKPDSYKPIVIKSKKNGAFLQRPYN